MDTTFFINYKNNPCSFKVSVKITKRNWVFILENEDGAAENKVCSLPLEITFDSKVKMVKYYPMSMVNRQLIPMIEEELIMRIKKSRVHA